MSPSLAGLPFAAPPASTEVGRWQVEPALTAARTLRHEVMTRWGQLEQDDAQPTAMSRLGLVLTELVTNSVQHGDGSIDVTLGRTTAGWLVVVSELRAPWHRPAPDLDAPETGGRGLSIVVAISTRCGWQRHAGELAVWAELPLTTGQAIAVAHTG